MIPRELKLIKQWICWHRENQQKVHLQINGEWARSNCETTWSTYTAVRQVAEKLGYEGVAFVISGDDPYCGVDLDNCLDETGILRPWAIPIIAQLDNCYAEISPSGTGIKFLTRGTKPAGARCIRKYGGDKQQIECYDSARFWCLTGDCYAGQDTIGDGQRSIDWICKTLEEGQPAPPSPVPRIATSPPPDMDLASMAVLMRGTAYVDAIAPQSEGTRNQTAFKTAGHLYALDENGCQLTEDQVQDLVLRWNDRNLPPIPAGEIEKAVHSAKRNGQLPRLKPSSQTILRTNGPPVKSEVAEPKSETYHVPQHLIDSAPGILSDIVEWIHSSALYTLPEITLGAALCALSAITGQKIRDRWNLRTNLYVLSLARTSAGKDHPRSRIQHLLQKAGGSPLLGAEDLASGAGLVSQLLLHPVCLLQLDEFGKMLSQVLSDKAPPHSALLCADLLKLYSASHREWTGRAYADSSRTPRIQQPHLVVHGTSTPSTVWRQFATSNVMDGLLGRIHLFDVAAYTPLRNLGEIDFDHVPETLLKRVQWWLEFDPADPTQPSSVNPVPYLMQHTEPAWDRYYQHLREISERRCAEDELRSALWGRSGEKAGKLALLAAAARGSLTIELSDVDWAIELQNCLTRKLHARVLQHVSDSPAESMRQRVMNVVKSRAQWTKTELNRKTPFLQGRNRDLLLTELQESELINVWTEGEGRQAKMLIAVRKEADS